MGRTLPRAPHDADRHGLFPSREQLLVLRGALGDGPDALRAYEAWLAMVDMSRDFDREVFRLIPLLYENLRRHGHQDALTGRLKGTYRLAWAKNHRLFDDTRPVLDRFLAAGLRVMALKGAPLALRYYGNLGVRPMSDVDFAVPGDQVASASQILAELGYRPWRSVDGDVRRFRHAVGFQAPGQKEVDLHWHMLLDLCDETADDVFWKTAQPFRFLDRDILAPDPSRLLLLTIIHGLRWNPEPPVRWIPDAVMILRHGRQPIDWDWLVGFADREASSRTGSTSASRIWPGSSRPRFRHRPWPGWRSIRPTWRERLELRTLLKPVRYESAMGPLLDALAEFPRMPGIGGPFRTAGAFTHFLRFHWGLSGRREIPRRLLQGLRRRTVAGAAGARG